LSTDPAVQPCRRAAEKELINLQHQVDEQRVAASAVSLKDVMAEWLRTSEIEESTRKTYAGYKGLNGDLECMYIGC
jgi:hypothetical protein